MLVAIGLTTVSIDATDALRGSNSALSIFATQVMQDTCPDGMVEVTTLSPPVCVDVFEASVGDHCPVPDPTALRDTAINVNDQDCRPESQAGKSPWVFVARHQAESLCAKAGKRLATPHEWYAASLGSMDRPGLCTVDSTRPALTGSRPDCRSSIGAYDMIGNVWELVAAEVVDGYYADRTLPREGYVAAVDGLGLPSRSTTSPQVAYNADYMWSTATGTYSLMRGGFYGSQSDAGIYTVHAAIDPTFSSAAIGFRCARDL